MLILLLTAVDSSGQIRDFAYGTHQLESGLEFINELVNKGTTLLRVKLIENGQCVVLPLEAFDGSSFTDPMEELEKEWLGLLAE